MANGINERVAIGFEGGEDPQPAIAILDTLLANSVKVTFFLDGLWVDECPEVVRRIVADGHELGNHGYGHRDWKALDDDALRADLEHVETIATHLVGVTTKPWVLPPKFAIDDRISAVLAAEGYRAVNAYPLDSRSWPDTSAAAIHERAISDLEGGANLITIHTGRSESAVALTRILKDLGSRAITVTTLSALGESPRYPDHRSDLSATV